MSRTTFPVAFSPGRVVSVADDVLTDIVDARGLHAAIRIAVGRVEQGARGRRMVEYRRRLLGYYESMW